MNTSALKLLGMLAAILVGVPTVMYTVAQVGGPPSGGGAPPPSGPPPSAPPSGGGAPGGAPSGGAPSGGAPSGGSAPSAPPPSFTAPPPSFGGAPAGGAPGGAPSGGTSSGSTAPAAPTGSFGPSGAPGFGGAPAGGAPTGGQPSGPTGSAGAGFGGSFGTAPGGTPGQAPGAAGAVGGPAFGAPPTGQTGQHTGTPGLGAPPGGTFGQAPGQAGQAGSTSGLGGFGSGSQTAPGAAGGFGTFGTPGAGLPGISQPGTGGTGLAGEARARAEGSAALDAFKGGAAGDQFPGQGTGVSGGFPGQGATQGQFPGGTGVAGETPREFKSFQLFGGPSTGGTGALGAPGGFPGSTGATGEAGQPAGGFKPSEFKIGLPSGFGSGFGFPGQGQGVAGGFPGQGATQGQFPGGTGAQGLGAPQGAAPEAGQRLGAPVATGFEFIPKNLSASDIGKLGSQERQNVFGAFKGAVQVGEGGEIKVAEGFSFVPPSQDTSALNKGFEQFKTTGAKDVEKHIALMEKNLKKAEAAGLDVSAFRESIESNKAALEVAKNAESYEDAQGAIAALAIDGAGLAAQAQQVQVLSQLPTVEKSIKSEEGRIQKDIARMERQMLAAGMSEEKVAEIKGRMEEGLKQHLESFTAAGEAKQDGDGQDAMAALEESGQALLSVRQEVEEAKLIVSALKNTKNYVRALDKQAGDAAKLEKRLARKKLDTSVLKAAIAELKDLRSQIEVARKEGDTDAISDLAEQAAEKQGELTQLTLASEGKAPKTAFAALGVVKVADTSGLTKGLDALTKIAPIPTATASTGGAGTTGAGAP